MSNAPFAWSSLYSSTKEFNSFHSQALSLELAEKIDVMCLKPLYVSTNMTSKREGPEVINIEECAQGALRHLGYEWVTYGHWKHQLQGWILEKIVRCNWIFSLGWSLIGKKSIIQDVEKYNLFIKKGK